MTVGSHIAARPVPGAPIPARRAGDALGLLTLFVALLVGIPSRLIVAPLGGAGTPAQILGMLCLVAWVLVRVARPDLFARLHQPIRTAELCFGLAVLASYVVAMTRPIAAEEVRSADLGMLSLCGWCGISFVAMDGLGSRRSLDILLRRVVFAGGCLSSLGILQFVTHRPFTNYIKFPGLTDNNALVSIGGRDGFARPAGTTLHPIEFGVVLTMILPIALHYAIADTGRGRFRRWFPVASTAIALPISISRSAILGSVVVLVILLPTWERAARRAAYGVLTVLAGLLYVLVPGLLGTLVGLFTGISSDSSALSRTGSYGLAAQYVARAPLFGRGFLTFLPSYRILDNQYLGLLIDTGIVGVLAVLAVFASSIVTTRRVRHRSADRSTRQLSQALVASVAAAACSFAIFDALSFPMVPSLLFLLLGCAANLRRLTAPR